MDTDATDSPTPPPDAVHHLLLSPDRPPASGLVAKRRIREANALGSPRRRSPRLSGLPPQHPAECRDTRDTDENETSSTDDIDLPVSLEDTPENDYLPPDEPSTVLADRIMRAQDNPSPPPQDHASHNVSYAPEEGDHLLHEVSAPPSPFRPINLLERLNQLSYPPFQFSHDRRTSSLDDGAAAPESTPHGAVVPHESRVPSKPMKDVPRDDLASVNTPPLISAQRLVDELPSRSSQQVCETDLVDNTGIVPPSERTVEPHVQTITNTGSLESGVFGPSFTHADNSSSSHVVSPTSDILPQEPLPFSEQQNLHESPSNVLPSIENGQPSIATEVPFRKDIEEASSTDNNGLSISKEGIEGECGTTSTKESNSNSQQRMGSPSPHSTSVLDELCLPSESSVEQTPLRAEAIHIERLSTPPRTPGPSKVHPDFSTTTVQRPIIAPAPVRANVGSGKSNSPVKFSFEIDDIYRTPARRVPIETALTRGTPSFQRTAQLPVGTDQSQSRHFSTRRTPVFTRPALGDPSRSPAKRIPIADLTASRTKGHQSPSSPTRLSPRARSTSVEPRPLRSMPTRSRSVEPGVTISKPDNLGKTKESIFPNVPVVPRQGAKLPFPLVSGHKSSQDPLQPSIPEEPETAEVGSSENNAMLGRVTQNNPKFQLKQPSTSSRIPRVGSKPYARFLPKIGKSTVGTTSRSKADVSVHKTFRLSNKDNDVGNNDTEAPSTKPADDQRLGGSLKRKRGAEMACPSDSRPVMIRQVVPGMLNGKYAPKPANLPSQVQTLPESSPPKVPQQLKFRKVVDGMLSARYAPKARTEPSDPTSSSSPLSDLSSSNEGPDEKLPLAVNSTARPETSDTLRTDDNTPPVEPATHKLPSLHRSDANADEFSNRPRRTSRTRKQAQQQYVLDVFNSTTSTRPPPPRRKPQARTEGDSFMGMSAAALKVLTASNTTKNQQAVAVLATEVIRKEGLRPESPTVKARTILQKQRDERNVRRKEREQRKSQLSETGLGLSDTKGQADSYLDTHGDDDVDDEAASQKHRRGPGDEEDYETPERPERVIEPLRLEGVDRKVKPVKQVKWHRGLSTAVYLDEVDPKPLPRETSVRGCLAPTSKSLPLDNLGNLLDIDNRPLPELVTEQIVVKRYLYDNDLEPEPIPPKMTRSKSKKK